MSFMFGLGRESEAAGCFSWLVCAAGSLAKSSDLVTTEFGWEAGLQQCCSLSQNLFIYMDLIFTYLFFLFMCVHLPKWAIISYIHILNCFPVDMLPQEFHNSVCACVYTCVAVSGGAAACSWLSPSPLAVFPLQAVEVNVIMEPALLALPRGPAGWTLSFQLSFSPQSILNSILL